jgi:hypothetical protein
MPSSSKPESRRKELWIGLVEVRILKESKSFTDGKGAFVNVVTWATGVDGFKSNAELVLGKLGLVVLEVENPEPVSARRKWAHLDEEIEDIISRAETNPNAIIYGTFHKYLRDDA